jgi:hypothetical protein
MHPKVNYSMAISQWLVPFEYGKGFCDVRLAIEGRAA